MPALTAYCVKCRAKRTLGRDYTVIKRKFYGKNGHRQVTMACSYCKYCDTKMCRILTNKAI